MAPGAAPVAKCRQTVKRAKHSKLVDEEISRPTPKRPGAVYMGWLRYPHAPPFAPDRSPGPGGVDFRDFWAPERLLRTGWECTPGRGRAASGRVPELGPQPPRTSEVAGRAWAPGASA